MSIPVICFAEAQAEWHVTLYVWLQRAMTTIVRTLTGCIEWDRMTLEIVNIVLYADDILLLLRSVSYKYLAYLWTWLML